MFWSLNWGEMSCTPTGSCVWAPRPTGRLMPPLPAILMEMVNMSDRYMSVGSLTSPNVNAVRGETGATMQSTCS